MERFPTEAEATTFAGCETKWGCHFKTIQTAISIHDHKYGWGVIRGSFGLVGRGGAVTDNMIERKHGDMVPQVMSSSYESATIYAVYQAVIEASGLPAGTDVTIRTNSNWLCPSRFSEIESRKKINDEACLKYIRRIEEKRKVCHSKAIRIALVTDDLHTEEIYKLARSTAREALGMPTLLSSGSKVNGK